ncbi:S16 family serine protease [Chthoniobacter flavus]|uniref:S16 family serine protease n=1 Tax=Chthoniobacter flavus TaxID=191863 RepID=UPI0012FB14B8|nr:S16 family serine protease [Chthoniobacter flavus]
MSKRSRWPAIGFAAFCLGFVGWATMTATGFSPWYLRRSFHHWLDSIGTTTAQTAPASSAEEIEPVTPPSPDPSGAAAPSAPSIQAGEVEAPWFKHLFSNPKRRSVEDAGHLHLLFVMRPGTDGRMGLTSQIYATREAPDNVSAKLTTEVGSEMQTSFDEGLRYVRKRSRDWEQNFSVRLSFEDKFTSKDGGSAGTGFTIVMLAATQEIALDSSVAVTGDLTVDGTVQPVGAVVDKLRGAIVGKCKIALVPERNARDVVDFALLDGTSPLWEMQIFTIGTIDQALSLARTDRPGDVQQAIARFNALRARLPATVTPNYLQSPIVQTELKEVLRLAPNHLSAATLLKAAENQLPTELSLNRSVEEIVAASYLFVSDVVGPGESKARPVATNDRGLAIFPDREFNQCIKSLQRVTPILDPRSQDLKRCCIAYAGALRSMATYQPPNTNGVRNWQQINYLAQRESGFVSQMREDLQESRSRLLLAIRKLDTDGSLMSELLKK